MPKRKLGGIEKRLASDSLDFLSQYGIGAIQVGSRTLTKKGSDVIEERPAKKPKKRRSNAC